MLIKSTMMATIATIGIAAAPALAQINLSGETAGQGSVPGTVHSHIGEVLAAKNIGNLQIQFGQTLTNSVLNLAEGKSDIVSGPQVLPFLLSKGRGPYSKLGKKGAPLAANLRVLFTYSFGNTILYAFDSNGVKGWTDLKGRKVYNGPPRGAALVQARQIIQLMGGGKDGTDYTGVQVNWGQDIKTITDGSAEAIVLPATFPDRRVTAALASGKITLFSATKAIFETEQFQKYASTPGSAPFRIPVANTGYDNVKDQVTIHSEDELFRAVSITGAELVNKSMDEELAYQITKAVVESLDALKGKATWAPNVGLGVLTAIESGMCGINPLKYHPGAVRAWEEAGMKIPDCAKAK
ncbi:MAG: TAXI family TRAP transporter solute-binding subunit [Burkholderiaceae bacterium]